jgi:flavin-binding protein dodecin
MTEHVYKVIDIIGSSETSWEDAAKRAVEEASKSVKDLRIGEVLLQDVKIENGKVVAYRTKLSVSFRFHEELSHHG